MAPPLASFDQASFYYPRAERAALLDVDLVIQPSEIVGVIGPTGAGKTTLCLSLNGIVPQFQGGRFFGHITINGNDTVDHPIHELARSVALVFQDPDTQLVTASVEDEVAFTLENLRIPAAEIRLRVSEALSAVGLSGAEKKHPHELSGGQQQRLALAAALAVRPALIVLDEPTSQLDPRGTADVFQLVRQLNRSHGTTFLIASHASEELAETAQRIVVLAGGRIVALGSPAEIYRNAALLDRYKLRAPEVTTTFQRLASRGLTDLEAPITLHDGLRAISRFSAIEAPAAPLTPPIVNRSGVLDLDRVCFTYPDGTAALKTISLSIRQRDYVVILGQNGAGKSTLIKQFLGLLTPTSGTVRVAGKNITDYRPSELARRIGYVPQNPDRQIFNATVEAEIAFSLLTLKLSPDEKRRRVDKVMAALNLTSFRDVHPFSLSKGDRARVVIAAVLVMEPEILIFDEPTTGQDFEGATAILELTRTLNAQGRTIVVITHHLYLMPGYAQRALIMGQGTLLLDAPLREAYHDIDRLRSTDLVPTQAVTLARALHGQNRAITPAEVAALILPGDNIEPHRPVS